MTSHDTGSTTTPGTPRATAPPRAHVRPPGADPGRAQRRLPPGLSGPAVPVPEHRPRPDRPSRRLLWPRRARRRADHLPDPPVPTRQARRRGRPPAPSIARPRPSTACAPSPSTGAGSTPCPASPTACARIPPARASSNTPSTWPFAPTCPPRGRTSSTSPTTLAGARTRSSASPGTRLDEAGGVIRLSPARSKTLVGRILPISQADCRGPSRGGGRAATPTSPLVFHRDGIPVPPLAHGVAHRLSGGRGADPLPPRLPPHRRPQPDPRQRPRAGRHAP